MKKILCLGLFIFGLKDLAVAQTPKQRWVDSVYNKLTQREKVGQLFMVAAYSGGEKYNEPEIQKLINNKSIGGLIFMQGTPEAQAAQTNKYQKSAGVPLLIGMDAEWGLGMRLTGVKNFPRQMMLGATRDPALMEQMAMAIAFQCKRMGVHVDFAPVVDVNNNPDNPVINFRSFGDNKELVAIMAKAYSKGLQDNGIIACVKHFPGHGDVSVDSHLDLPVINKTKDQLKALELFPFQSLFNDGVKSVMIAHLSIPALDNRPHRPSTLSSYIVTDLLQKQMGFKGLIFTDALNMQGVAKYYPVGEVDLEAFLAGNDVLLFSQDVPKATEKIETAIKSGTITAERLATSVKKILAAKYDAGLNDFTPIVVENATEDLNQFTEAITDNIAKSAVTLVKDENSIIPIISYKPSGNYAYIRVGKDAATNSSNKEDFFEILKRSLFNLTVKTFAPTGTEKQLEALVKSVNQYDAVIVGMQDLNLYPKGDYGLSAKQLELLKKLALNKKVIFVNFGNAYALKYICNAKSSIVAYEENSSTYKAVNDVLLGRLKPKGTLPVHPCNLPVTEKKILKPGTSGIVVTQGAMGSRAGTAQVANTIDRVENKVVENNEPIVSTRPSNLIKNPQALKDLDAFLLSAKAKGTFPGCQVVAMKDGQMIYQKNIGSYNYGSSPTIENSTLYDLASVTKIASTTLAVMKLYEEGKLDLNATLGQYLPLVQGTDKANLRISNILMHQAGLKAWIPFYKSTLDSFGRPDAAIYSKTQSAQFSVPIAPNLFMKRSYEDTVWKTILQSPLSTPRYVYSDLDFLFLQKVVEQLSHQTIDVYVAKSFYEPMGLENTMFNPWKKQLQNRCAPAEQDNYYRYQLVQGYVHDMGAAMLGGVAGHAGLFSNATDLSNIMQMLLNGGLYKGKRYLKSETVKLFTNYHSGSSRRAYGFDKPEKAAGDGGPASDLCSKAAFGHQGFTGTCAWADPTTGIVFVFLSNRTNPSADNSLINRLSVRTVAQSYIYKALGYTK